MLALGPIEILGPGKQRGLFRPGITPGLSRERKRLSRVRAWAQILRVCLVFGSCMPGCVETKAAEGSCFQGI